MYTMSNCIHQVIIKRCKVRDKELREFDEQVRKLEDEKFALMVFVYADACNASL
jgi:hypothetical protein